MSSQEHQSMKKTRTAWRWWAKALGEKASKCDKESDKIAIIRTIIFASYLITNFFIIAGVIRQWNRPTNIEIQIDANELPSYLPEAQREEGKVYKRNRNFEYD